MIKARTKSALAPPSLARTTTRRKPRPRAGSALSRGALRCRAKFRRHFPGGFQDETYLDWERDYKWNAHRRWEAELNKDAFKRLVDARAYGAIAAKAIAIEARTNLLFS